MGNCASFIETASAKCGVDVGIGKLFLIYADKKTVTSAMLTAAAINAEIEAGTIIGVVKGWHTIAGAPVGEVSVEHPLTSAMKVIRPEILADTLTFESNIINRSVTNDLVNADTLNSVLVDDFGNAFGETSQTANAIDTMSIDFSGKVSSSLQKDNTTDKSVAVTVRYLVKDLGIYEAGIEVEEIATKVQLYAGINPGIEIAPTIISMNLLVKEKGSNKAYSGEIVVGDIKIEGAGVISFTRDEFVAGELALVITGTGFVSGDTVLTISMSGADFYMKPTKYIVRLGE